MSKPETLTIPGTETADAKAAPSAPVAAPAKTDPRPTAAQSLAKQKADDAAKKAAGLPIPGTEPKAAKAKKPKAPKPEIAPPAAKIPAPKASDLRALPDGIRKKLKLSDLVLDRALQIRVAVQDEHTVGEYAAIYQEAIAGKKEKPSAPEPCTVLPELRVVDTGENLYVWDGFQRAGGLEAAGLKECYAIVTPGTKKDAEFYALRANASHGLRRSSADCRRAVTTCLEDKELFDRVLASAKRYGGLNRAMAVACGVSKGLVSLVLRDRGETFKGDKVVKLPTRKQTDTGAPAPGGIFQPAAPNPADASVNPDSHLSPEQQAEKIKATATALLFAEAKAAASRLARIVEGMADRADVGDIIRDSFKASKLPITKKVSEGTKSGFLGWEWMTATQIMEGIEDAKRAFDAKAAAKPEPKSGK
jgi:hypothetical protein